jgi:hypothetical protein
MQLQKASPEVIKWMEEKLRLMTSPELDALEKRINVLIEEREKVFLAQKLSKDQLLSLYRGYGYDPQPGDKFWKITAKGQGYGMYGWQVGQYEHSCHIDSTDIKVLLVIEPQAGGTHYVCDHSDLWLDGPIVV